MGNYFRKDTQPIRMTSEERAFVYNAFMLVSHDKGYLKPQDLIDAWSYLVSPGFVEHMKNACFRISKGAPIKLKPFLKLFYIAVKGNVPEKALYISRRVLDKSKEHPRAVLTSELIDLTQSLVDSYFMMISHQEIGESGSWELEGLDMGDSDIQIYLQYAVKEIKNCYTVTVPQIERWLYREPLLMQIWKEVMYYLYSHLNSISLPKYAGCRTIPTCFVPNNYGPISSILSIGKVMFINDALPIECRYLWTPLYNSKLHGESFATMVAKITHQGPTILVIQDDSSFVFGGFAPVSWSLGANFTGDPTSVLFTLLPKMDRHGSSGYNKHYQYLNMNQKTIPNGLGMGGQFHYWGLYLDQKFGKGSSATTCTTFSDYAQMSGREDFDLRHLEVWSVGRARLSTTSDDSVLTIVNRESEKNFLELAGHDKVKH